MPDCGSSDCGTDSVKELSSVGLYQAVTAAPSEVAYAVGKSPGPGAGPNNLLPGAPGMALLARTGTSGPWTYIGAGPTEFSGDGELFFAVNDDMALGVADALRAAGRSGAARVIGVDGIAEAIEAVRTGALDATVSQYPYVMGAMAIEACTAAARGATLPKRVDAPIALLTRDNVGRAIAAFPKPVDRYSDPFSRLLVR